MNAIQILAKLGQMILAMVFTVVTFAFTGLLFSV
jgi:hypothetical protein